jgi:hypothetical protein
LYGKEMFVTEKNLEIKGRKSKTQERFFTIGSNHIQPDLLLSKCLNSNLNEDVIPRSGGGTFLFVLLYIPNYDLRSHEIKTITLDKDPTGGYLFVRLNDEREGIITEYLQDSILIGETCKPEHCGTFEKWLYEKPQVMSLQGKIPAFPDFNDWVSDRKPYLSISRCSSNHHPMQYNDFQETEPTPKSSNLCKDERSTIDFPFNFRAIRIQSTAQKMAINLLKFYEAVDSNPSLLSGTPRNLVSRSLNIALSTTTQIIKNFKQGQIKTPSRKHPRKPAVMGQLDALKIEILKKTVQSFFSENRAPTLDDVYKRFLERMEADSAATRTAFRCSPKTLRRILRSVGFKFGKIDLRSVILQRNDIVAKREEYLRIMRSNRNSPNPKPIVWTDETWIDPHSR